MEGWADVSALMRCGVYALGFKGSVVYVGKSTKPFARLASHLNLLAKQRKGIRIDSQGGIKAVYFDAVHFRGCMLSEIDDLERLMIRHYQPKHNVACLRRVSLHVAGFNFERLGIIPVEPSRMERRI